MIQGRPQDVLQGVKTQKLVTVQRLKVGLCLVFYNVLLYNYYIIVDYPFLTTTSDSNSNSKIVLILFLLPWYGVVKIFLRSKIQGDARVHSCTCLRAPMA